MWGIDMVTSRWANTLLFRVVRSAALAFVLVMIGVAALQDRLLYYPELATVSETLAATGVKNARAWPSKEQFRGVLAEPLGVVRGVADSGTAIVFHGNAGHAGNRGEYIEVLSRKGFRVVLAEYPGYGARPGALGEVSLVADAVETIAKVRRQFGDPVFLVGESLGAGVASAAAGQVVGSGESIAGLLLITPWDALANVAAHHYPWLPVRWLLKDRYASVANLAGFFGPTVVVLAADDRIVPARFGDALYGALSGRKMRFSVAGADHNDWIVGVDDAWWQEVMKALLGRRSVDKPNGAG